MHACDRQTDGRMDGRTDRNLITIPRLHYMQRGKKSVKTSRSYGHELQDVGFFVGTVYDLTTHDCTVVLPSSALLTMFAYIPQLKGTYRHEIICVAAGYGLKHRHCW